MGWGPRDTVDTGTPAPLGIPRLMVNVVPNIGTSRVTQDLLHSASVCIDTHRLDVLSLKQGRARCSLSTEFGDCFEGTCHGTHLLHPLLNTPLLYISLCPRRQSYQAVGCGGFRAGTAERIIGSTEYE